MSRRNWLFILVKHGLALGAVKRISNVDICSYLLQPMQKQQLVNLGIDNVYTFTAPSDSQLNEYLENPPAGIWLFLFWNQDKHSNGSIFTVGNLTLNWICLGIDGRLWKQAQLDNPDKEKFIPVPINGFNGILWRAKCQEEQIKLHEGLLDGVSEDISNMQREHVATNVKLSELKQKTLELEHRVLKVFKILI